MEVVVKSIGTAFTVAVIPVLKDNYSYVIHDKATNTLAAVDVSADIDPVIDYVRRLGGVDRTTDLRTILSTHKHHDHSGGNISLQKKLNATGAFRIIGGANEPIPGVTEKVREGDHFSIGELKVDVLDAPCHTSGHVLYKVYHPQKAENGIALFTGDTMFVGGIGAFFEGDAVLMCSALRKVYNLNCACESSACDATDVQKRDNHTYIFPGHEYTVNFLRFSRDALPASHPDVSFVEAQLRRYTESVAGNVPTVPSTLAEEKRQNLFLRTCDEAFVRVMNKGETAVKLMDFLYNTCP